MTVQAISVNKHLHDNNKQTISKQDFQDTSIFYKSGVSSPYNAQTKDITGKENLSFNFENAQTNSDKVAILKELYQYSKNEQGVIGDVIDGFKNLFKTKNCSKNIEQTINNLNENSTNEEIQAAKDMLDKYNSNQESGIKGVASTGAMMAGGAAGAKLGAVIGSAICPGLGTVGGFLCGVAIGAVAGALTNIGINQIENMTDNVKDNSWHNDENLLKEAGEGALSGGSAVLMGGITQKVTGAVASKVGLTTVENGGMVALAENGTAKVGSTVAKNAFAHAIGGGTAATVVTDGGYILECALDKDKDFSLTDFGTTSFSSFAFGGLIGGATGGIQGYKGAISYNGAPSELNTTKTISETKVLEEGKPEAKVLEEGKAAETSAAAKSNTVNEVSENDIIKEAIEAEARENSCTIHSVELTEEQIEKAYNHVKGYDGIEKLTQCKDGGWKGGIKGCHNEEFYERIFAEAEKGNAEGIKAIFNEYGVNGKGAGKIKIIDIDSINANQNNYVPNDNTVALEISGKEGTAVTRKIAFHNVGNGRYAQYMPDTTGKWQFCGNKTVSSEAELEVIKNILTNNTSDMLLINNRLRQPKYLFGFNNGSRVDNYYLHLDLSNNGKQVITYYKCLQPDSAGYTYIPCIN